MLRVKSLVILKANPDTLKCGGGIKMRMWMCVKEGVIRIWKQSQSEEDRKKYCEAKKDAKKIVYMAMHQKACEAVEKIDSCHDGHELFGIAKGLRRREMLLGLVVLKMKVERWKCG